MAFWGREGGGVAKCLKIFSWKMMGTVSKKPKRKTPKILQSSSHKWVLGEILQKLKGCLGKNSREFCLCVCVCDGLHLPRKKGKVKILHLPPKKKRLSTAPSHLAS